MIKIHLCYRNEQKIENQTQGLAFILHIINLTANDA